jgi:hypothetical protein
MAIPAKKSIMGKHNEAARETARQTVHQLRKEWWGSFSVAAAKKIPEQYDRSNLFLVCTHGDTMTLFELLHNGANLHAQNDLALRLAAKHGHTDAVRILLNDGADVHAANDTALKWAARAGHVETVYVLVEHGAPLKKLSPEQRKAYHNVQFKQADAFLTADKEALNLEQILTELGKATLTQTFKAATWAGHVSEMIKLWNEVPQPLRANLDFQRILVDTRIQTNKLSKPKITLIK